MDVKELVERIEKYEGELPRPRFVIETYAEVIAKLSERLTSADVDDLVALGALVKLRSSQLIPLYRWDAIPEELMNGRPIV